MPVVETQGVRTQTGLGISIASGAAGEDLSDSADHQRESTSRQVEAELAEAVIDYLAEHPQAMDTLTGIAEWWIERQRIRVDVETLGRVLRRLTEQGLLEEITTGTVKRYRLKP